MQTGVPTDAGDEEPHEPAAKPLTAQQAEQLRGTLRHISLVRVVAVQWLVGVVLVLLGLWLAKHSGVAKSLAYGAFAVVLPASVFACAVRRYARRAGHAAMLGLLVWEMIKLALTVVLLVLAPWVVPGLLWGWLLVGLVVTLKVYWVALFWLSRSV